MKELQSTSQTSIVASIDSTGEDAEEADDDACETDSNSKLFEKYAPVIAQFKVNTATYFVPDMANNSVTTFSIFTHGDFPIFVPILQADCQGFAWTVLNNYHSMNQIYSVTEKQHNMTEITSLKT